MTATMQKVSIPFKRESVSKGYCPNRPRAVSEFQFPSNGKVYPKRGFWHNDCPTWKVSIPFKRESVSKEMKYHDEVLAA